MPTRFIQYFHNFFRIISKYTITIHNGPPSTNSWQLLAQAHCLTSRKCKSAMQTYWKIALGSQTLPPPLGPQFFNSIKPHFSGKGPGKFYVFWKLWPMIAIEHFNATLPWYKNTHRPQQIAPWTTQGEFTLNSPSGKSPGWAPWSTFREHKPTADNKNPHDRSPKLASKSPQGSRSPQYTTETYS